MATPTNYDLSYDDPCSVESGCGGGDCGGKPEFNSRPQVFCKEVTINGTTTIVPAAVTVGGQTFTPTVIGTISGPHLVLAVY
jgi:hypothetical protein